MSGLVWNSKRFPRTGKGAPCLWVKDYRAVVGGLRGIPKPLSEHAGGGGRKLEVGGEGRGLNFTKLFCFLQDVRLWPSFR